ncbi:hypothetical protein C9J01_13175 [Photobacterium rosenbergii]|uniref:Lipoprotein n=1 Tax=Photobacterium rosenbergii TaxID=294936 RepID=A0A2T3NEN4_9GAMM|nr:hypothetical protein [Photobacterium rosenbergii]PSW12869.1 hypothetical protein C9J01_13175 [Photobacterium rosenbergii]
MTFLLKFAGLSLFCIILLGCAETRHETLSDLGFTRPYLDGYQDGCFSRKNEPSTHLDGFRQDPERMEADNKYAYGWHDGYDQCYADNKEYL